MSRSSFFFVFFILILSNSILSYISFSRSTVSVLKKDCAASAEFRQQDLSPELYRQLTESGLYPSDWCDLLTTTMLNSHFHPQHISPDNTFYLLYKKSCYLQLKNCYEDSWMDSRTYGGNRHHEGTDLFGPVSQSGYYPIISITDGIVEQKGWLPLGGYRIGIRSDSGGYFYYAHLSSYEEDFTPGDRVQAGEILGFMGNTGYGQEGTSERFPVHLHLGIYITTPEGQDISVNPYHVLQCLRKKIRKYTYY